MVRLAATAALMALAAGLLLSLPAWAESGGGNDAAQPQQASTDSTGSASIEPVAGTSLFSGNGLTVSMNGTVGYSDGFNFTILRSGEPLYGVAWRPDGSYAIIYGARGKLFRFEAGILNTILTPSHSDLITAAWAPDGTYALVGGKGGTLLRYGDHASAAGQVDTGVPMNIMNVRWEVGRDYAFITGEDGTVSRYPPPDEPPVVSILAPADGTHILGKAVVKGTARDSGRSIVGVEVSLDGGEWVAAGYIPDVRLWTITFDSLTDGVHVLQARAFDGLLYSAHARVGFTVGVPVVSTAPPVVATPVQEAAQSPPQPAGTATAPTVECPQAAVPCAPAGAVTAPSPQTVSAPEAADPFTPAASPFGGPDLNTVPSAAPVPAEDIVEPAHSAPAVPPAAAALFAGMAALSFAATENSRFGLFKLFLIPLYTRMKRDTVLDHFTRGRIYGFIESHPGTHYSHIKDYLGLKNGSVVYHLSVLERQGLIKSLRDGLYRRFYPVNYPLQSETPGLSPVQERIFNEIVANPGISQKEVALHLGVTPRVLSYHVRQMSQASLLRVERGFRGTRCFAVEQVNT